MRHAFIIVLLLSIFSAISYQFWYNEWKYSLPTPVPKKHKEVAKGTTLDINKKLSLADGKPALIHFFNPECPCSRFNMKHFKSLVKHYNKEMSFAIVVLCKEKEYTEREIQDKFDLDIPVSFDETLANTCGVYSTPQAVVIDREQKLFYKGNYNKSRYCTDKNSNYAQMAIDSLLNNHYNVAFDQYALKAYGCELPFCSK
jgi:hypothetical protein